MHRRNSVLYHNTGVVANTASTTVTSRNTAFPSNPVVGQLFILSTDDSTEDVFYQYIQGSDGNYGWWEVSRAS